MVWLGLVSYLQWTTPSMKPDDEGFAEVLLMGFGWPFIFMVVGMALPAWCCEKAWQGLMRGLMRGLVSYGAWLRTRKETE